MALLIAEPRVELVLRAGTRGGVVPCSICGPSYTPKWVLRQDMEKCSLC